MKSRYMSPIYMNKAYINKIGVGGRAKDSDGASILFQDNPF